jgi:glycosyltransferase involved in cell wall biosynthesis
MRLLYLGSSDFPQPKARAIQIVNTCHALARAGADITLVVGHRGRASVRAALAQYGLAPQPRLRIIRVPILRIPPSAPAPILRRFTRVWQASYLAGLAAVLPSQLVGRPPAVVYARDLRTARLVAPPAAVLGARLAFEVHGLPSYEARLRAGRSALPPADAARLRRLEDEVFSRADHVNTITECARRILIDDYGLPAKKVSTVPDATTAPISEHGPTPPVPRNGQLPAVYYVGQLYPWKGADLVVDTAARVPGARFVVVGGLPGGDGRDPNVEQLDRRARRLGVAERVELRGYVPYGRVPGELRHAAVALVPLPDEPVARLFTSPLKLFDYMAAGSPIGASDLPAVREILRDGENALLVQPGSPSAFAGAVNRLLANPSLARRLAARAREDVLRHTWEARAARLIDILSAGPAVGA